MNYFIYLFGLLIMFFGCSKTPNTAPIYEEVPTTMLFILNMADEIELDNFDTETQFVDVAGTFNSWEGEHLESIDDSLYTITITNVLPNDIIEFKFRIDGDWENAEFPGGGDNRTYIVEKGDNTLEYCYNQETCN